VCAIVVFGSGTTIPTAGQSGREIPSAILFERSRLRLDWAGYANRLIQAGSSVLAA
jgi:hypothetical protein